MSGEHLRDDDDFLDDDFVLEDDGVVGDVPQEEVPPPMAAAVPAAPVDGDQAPADEVSAVAEDDLDALFEPLPVAEAASIVELDSELAGGDAAGAEDAADDLFAIAEPDASALADEDAPQPAAAEDVLFEVPEVQPEPVFEAPPTFDATGSAGWNADELPIDEPTVAESSEDPTDEMLHGDASHLPLTPEAVEAVTREFERELESLDAVLAEVGDEDLVVDSDQDLELVDAPETEFVEAAEPDFLAADETFDDLPTLEPFDDDALPLAAASAESYDDVVEASAAEDLPTLEPWDDQEFGAEGAEDPSWTPLDPAAQELAEEPVENPYAEEYYANEQELVDRASEELYVEEEPVAELAPVIGGPRPARRWVPILMSAAASVAILTSGAVVVTRPEWFGLSLAPERVPSAQVERPAVAPVVKAPVLPPLPVAPVEVSNPTAEPTTETPSEGQATTVPTVAPTTAADPSIATSPGTVVTPSVPGEPTDPATQPSTNEPSNTQPSTIVASLDPAPKPGVEGQVGAGAEGSSTQAVASQGQEPAPEANVVVLPVPIAQKSHGAESGAESLVRVSDQLLVGGSIELPPSRPSLPDGLTLGSRAFAQLHNGNYFVGSVKRIEEAALTLLVDEGEVSLPKDSIVRLTKLGAGDYEALMKVTEGSVRLTNSNKLVGSIIRDIADDHVVLEFRSNRVVLPKSAVNDIVEGAASGGVRLGTTAQEENWLREIAERELGSGRAPTEQPKASGAGAAPNSVPSGIPGAAPQAAPVPPMPAFPTPKR